MFPVQAEEDNDPGAKAPHGDSSDEGDEQLAENLRKASSVVNLVSREGACAVSEPRSDRAGYDEEEARTSTVTSSKATIGVKDHRP